MVIEVADSFLQHDREVKLSLYAEAGIPEYWIVTLSSLDLTLAPRQLTG